MQRNHRQLNAALLGGLLAGLLASCGSTPKEQPSQEPNNKVIVNDQGEMVYEWWNNPTDLGSMVAVGSYRVVGNISMARTGAAADGRAQLAASLKAEIQSLAELWAQEAGDLTNEASLSSMINNETFTRQLVDTTLKGSTVQRYYHDKDTNTLYALVVLEDPALFTDNLVDMADESIQDEAYFETEARKSQARDRLDGLVGNRKAELEAEKAALQAKLGNG